MKPTKGVVSLRILDCPNDFADTGKVDFPAIVEIFQDRVFLANPSMSFSRDVNCVAVHDEKFAGFWKRYFKGLWDACESLEVMGGSVINRENLNRVVFARVKDYVKYLVATPERHSIATPDDLLARMSVMTEVFADSWWVGGRKSADGRPYARQVIAVGKDFEVMVAYWHETESCLAHDHGDSHGIMKVLAGQAEVHDFAETEVDGVLHLKDYEQKTISAEDSTFCSVTSGIVHSMRPAVPGLVTLHIYQKPIPKMRVFCRRTGKYTVVSSSCGAWWPKRDGELHAGARELDVVFD